MGAQGQGGQHGQRHVEEGAEQEGVGDGQRGRRRGDGGARGGVKGGGERGARGADRGLGGVAHPDQGGGGGPARVHRLLLHLDSGGHEALLLGHQHGTVYAGTVCPPAQCSLDWKMSPCLPSSAAHRRVSIHSSATSSPPIGRGGDQWAAAPGGLLMCRPQLTRADRSLLEDLDWTGLDTGHRQPPQLTSLQ